MFRKKVLDPDQREAELIALIREKAGAELDELWAVVNCNVPLNAWLDYANYLERHLTPSEEDMPKLYLAMRKAMGLKEEGLGELRVRKSRYGF